jgi:hypothetical protein
MRNPTRTLPTCRNSESTRLARYLHRYSSALVWDFDLVSTVLLLKFMSVYVFFFFFGVVRKIL